MLNSLLHSGAGKEEKKVEYIELIYDLIFVYIIGRNSTLLHTAEGGFIPAETYITYLITTLIALQIWYFTVLFINRYGDNGPAEYICLFINMYLLYFMGDATRIDWRSTYARYNTAWALILVNLAVQYILKLKKSDGSTPLQDNHIKLTILSLLVQAGIIFVSIPVCSLTGFPLSLAALVFGLVFAGVFGSALKMVPVDFSHLSERVMLYVVFTFGEMIISIAGYFQGGFTFNTIYYSLMGFLIVVGLFLTYGYFYDRVINRECCTSGTAYMLLHIFLIAALNNLTISLELMREDEVSITSKNIFLVVSFLCYFGLLFALQAFAKYGRRPTKRFTLILFLISASFVILMCLLYRNSAASIAVTVIYIYAMYLGFCLRGKRIQQEHL